MTVFVDLDGVLADFDKYYFEQFGIWPDKEAPNDPPGFWDRIKEHGSFYRSLPVMSDAMDLLQGILSYGYDPVILAGIPTSIQDSVHQKTEWVEEHFPDYKIICCRSRDKHLFGRPGDVLIDDRRKYANLWERMGGTFIHHKSAADSLRQFASVCEQFVDESSAGSATNN